MLELIKRGHFLCNDSGGREERTVGTPSQTLPRDKSLGLFASRRFESTYISIYRKVDK